MKIFAMSVEPISKDQVVTVEIDDSGHCTCRKAESKELNSGTRLHVAFSNSGDSITITKKSTNTGVPPVILDAFGEE